MPKKQVQIRNELGLHMVPAKNFVFAASQYPCDIFVVKDNMKVNAKSIMSVLTLVAGKGTKLTIIAEGECAEEALAHLEQLVLEKFGVE